MDWDRMEISLETFDSPLYFVYEWKKIIIRSITKSFFSGTNLLYNVTFRFDILIFEGKRKRGFTFFKMLDNLNTFFSFIGVRQEQDIYVRLIDSVTKQVR